MLPTCLPFATENVFAPAQVDDLLRAIELHGSNHGFGIRNFLHGNPAVLEAISAARGFRGLVSRTFRRPVIIKSLYFDKPPSANWAVQWHQDLTVNFTRRLSDPGYRNWRELPDRVVAQPPTALLNNIVTYRIHLDDADADNGALRAVPQGQDWQPVRINEAYWRGREQSIRTYPVARGGVLTMRPLKYSDTINHTMISGSFRRLTSLKSLANA